MLYNVKEQHPREKKKLFDEFTASVQAKFKSPIGLFRQCFLETAMLHPHAQILLGRNSSFVC
jgi:hypothetical protein